jgi:thiol-disulfide isomerase/thioredoxin
MKKKLALFFAIIVILIVSFSQFGIDIGGIRIGKQLDLKTTQKYDVNKSSFFINYYSKKNLTVLNLWATWCKPCINEMIDLNKIKNNYSKEDINFISMSVDTDSIKLINFISKKKFKFKDITLENLSYRNSILNTLENRKPEKWISTNVVPVTYIIKDKRVIAKIEGEIDYKELIDLIEKNK